MLRPVLLAAVVSASGCTFDEGLIIENLKGTVRVPKAAVTRTIETDSGPLEITDARLLGPVYLGLFPGMEEAFVIDRYPHPEVGPQYLADVAGNTYPYGGTTVSDLRYACLDSLVCKVAGGKYLNYQEIVDWFALVGQPVTDLSGADVTDGQYIQQICFDILNVTSDEEVRLIETTDRNLDGEVNELDLQWQDDGDSFVADFTIWQQEYFWDVDQEDCTPGTDCAGFTLWGWMDAPSTTSYQYSTCNPQTGFINNWYNSQFQGGAAYVDTLNFPTKYIADGDWTASQGFRWDNVYDQPELVLDFEVE